MAAALAPGIEGKTINLGTGETHSVGWFADRLLGLMDISKPIVQEEQRLRPESSEVMKLVSDNTLARRSMSWSPKIALEDGLLKTIAFVTANRGLYRTDGYVK
jgi:dTDP-glucose 4,6-dehydratase